MFSMYDKNNDGTSDKIWNIEENILKNDIFGIRKRIDDIYNVTSTEADKFIRDDPAQMYQMFKKEDGTFSQSKYRSYMFNKTIKDLFQKMDSNNDGRVSRKEFAESYNPWF